jgi:hypothetical protein
MNFNLIKRKFDIKVVVIFYGREPTEADINITAVYKTRLHLLTSVGDQLANVTAYVKNTYKQKIPLKPN